MTEIEQPPAPPALRWYQYRLRSLLILTTLTAVFFSVARTLGYVDALVSLAAVAILVGFLRYPRRVHLVTGVALVLIAATLLWANLRRTGWEEVWGERAPPGFAALARTMYYHGWPACPFMVSPPRGMPPYSDGLEWTPLVLNGIVFALALFVARVICQWCVLGGVMRIRRIFGITLLTLLLIYIGSYALLSSGGCYEPAAIGLNGVKWYGWAPRGFVDHYRWKRWPGILYVPLYVLDIRAWHANAYAAPGRYPVDEVKPKDIWKVYKAYGF